MYAHTTNACRWCLETCPHNKHYHQFHQNLEVQHQKIIPKFEQLSPLVNYKSKVCCIQKVEKFSPNQGFPMYN